MCVGGLERSALCSKHAVTIISIYARLALVGAALWPKNIAAVCVPALTQLINRYPRAPPMSIQPGVRNSTSVAPRSYIKTAYFSFVIITFPIPNFKFRILLVLFFSSISFIFFFSLTLLLFEKVFLICCHLSIELFLKGEPLVLNCNFLHFCFAFLSIFSLFFCSLWNVLFIDDELQFYYLFYYNTMQYIMMLF